MPGAEDWTEIRRLAGLRRADLCNRAGLVVARTTARAALASSGPAAMSEGGYVPWGGDQPETASTCSASASSLCCADAGITAGSPSSQTARVQPKLYAVC